MPLLPSSLAALFSLFMLGASAAEERHVEPGPSPSFYPLSRYLDLWDTGWFAAPAEETGNPLLAVNEETPFPFVLVGLAELKGRRWVYLRDEKGGIVELTFGKPAAGLNLVRVEAGSPTQNGSVCLISLGGRVTPLRFDGELELSRRILNNNSRPQSSKPGAAGRFQEAFGR